MLKVFERRPIANFSSGVFPALYVLAAIIGDHYMPGPPITPALCTLGLLLMSLILATPWMVFWALAYSGIVITLFHVPTFYLFTAHTRQLPLEVTLDIRAFTFFCVGIFASTFSYLLNKHRKSLEELHEIISRFPDPIVISDLSGTIINCNNKVVEKLGISKKTLIGNSYFDYFSSPDLKGRTIAKYLRFFDGDTREVELKLSLGNHSYVGETLILESSGNKLLLTVFKKPRFTSIDEQQPVPTNGD
jgi:PAS domain S-box-containing protein